MDRERDRLTIEQLKYDENGLIPAVVQQYDTGEVLMLAYMNAESLRRTVETRRTCFWSRSRQSFWVKGEMSGSTQDVKAISYDCDADTLLVLVDQHGSGACHTGERTCFYRDLLPQSADGADSGALGLGDVLEELFTVLESRKKELPEGSYTAQLLSGPQDKLLKKIGEEASEVIIAARDHDAGQTRYEIADLVYHLLVVMVREGLTPQDLAAELAGRRK